ncbi:RrF2 family transcriptional regulator [Streptomyces sp. NPDC016640]|uniref:RrF2 family transcriptional regulator n=1 Tax=Streptomyces sp. NPDC016640 TaxID=3364969 RepID=UPI0036F8162B
MKLTNGVEWALHCCVSLSQSQVPVSAGRLAKLHGIPPAYLAKHLQSLSQAGILRSTPGPVGGYTFARPTEQVTVLDVVRAVDGPEPAFRCTEIRRKGPLALRPEKCTKPCAVSRAMAAAETAWRAALRDITIADLTREIEADSDGTAMDEVRQWLTGRSEPPPSASASSPTGPLGVA